MQTQSILILDCHFLLAIHNIWLKAHSNLFVIGIEALQTNIDKLNKEIKQLIIIEKRIIT